MIKEDEEAISGFVLRWSGDSVVVDLILALANEILLSDDFPSRTTITESQTESARLAASLLNLKGSYSPYKKLGLANWLAGCISTHQQKDVAKAANLRWQPIVTAMYASQSILSAGKYARMSARAYIRTGEPYFLAHASCNSSADIVHLLAYIVSENAASKRTNKLIEAVLPSVLSISNNHFSSSTQLLNAIKTILAGKGEPGDELGSIDTPEYWLTVAHMHRLTNDRVGYVSCLQNALSLAEQGTPTFFTCILHLDTWQYLFSVADGHSTISSAVQMASSVRPWISSQSSVPTIILLCQMVRDIRKEGYTDLILAVTAELCPVCCLPELMKLWRDLFPDFRVKYICTQLTGDTQQAVRDCVGAK